MREGEENYDDFYVNEPTPEEAAEASFYFFIQDLNHYAQSGKFGPRIWNAVNEETRQVMRNMAAIDKLGLNLEKELTAHGYRT